MSASFYDLMKYAHTGLATADMTAFDKLRAQEMAGGGAIKTLTGVPPLSFTGNGKPLISLSMLGNGQQSGTPAPDAPIMPELVGEKTENLFDGTFEQGSLDQSSAIGSTYEQTKSGTVSNRIRITNLVYCGRTCTISVDFSKYQIFVLYYDQSKLYIHSDGGGWKSEPFTVNQPYVGIIVRRSDNSTISPSETDINLMLNLGSTALPYEPYGYKLPITCAGQTVPVYLGEVQTVRRIKKLVLTGEENWSSQHLDVRLFALEINGYLRIPAVTSICTHYRAISNVDGWASVSENRCVCFYRGTSANNILYIRDMTYATVDAFKTFLQQQYQNGTPVTVWYVLAEPKTAIVNEPLAKIDTYADRLDSEDAGVSIPTARGQNTLTVDTDLKPSEMTITYRG